MQYRTNSGARDSIQHTGSLKSKERCLSVAYIPERISEVSKYGLIRPIGVNSLSVNVGKPRRQLLTRTSDSGHITVSPFPLDYI